MWKMNTGENELGLDEWERILHSLGDSPYWITVSGGEPFLYNEIEEFCQMVATYCKPAIINIPTNGIHSELPEKVGRIASACQQTEIIINLSLDGVGKKHDIIRGVPGNFDRFRKTLAALQELQASLPNLVLGVHTVVSRFNVDHLERLITYVDNLEVDQYITEIAEERVELGTVGSDIAPGKEAYTKAVEKLSAHLEKQQYHKISRVTRAFRLEYYRLVEQILEDETQVIPCYAGWASAQIFVDGTVWPCCVRADNLGNLRDFGYEFSPIWFGEKTKRVRRSIAARECHCPLANTSYTNMLHHFPTLARMGKRIFLG